MAGAVFDAARADVDAGLADAALVKLDTLSKDDLRPEQQLQFHLLRASAYSLQGSLLNALRERAAADPLLADPALKRRNQEAILEALTLLPASQLNGYPTVAGDALSGWLALGRALTSDDPSQSLAQWRQDYPALVVDAALLQAHTHRRAEPAAAAAPMPGTVPPATQAPAGAGDIVAILLPASGSSAAFGEALRQGMLAARQADEAAVKPELRFYDSEAGDSVAQYRKAVQEGASLVIGPLRKEQVAALAGEADLPTPVLALNQTDTERDGFYQFSLLPEDELEQAADHAWGDGRQNALLLVPAKDFGQRMQHHFKDYWQRWGGRVAGVQTYAPGEKDYAATIKRLLQAGEPGKESIPTPGVDADVIFLIADARDARLLVPQLRYYGATRLPIYATSAVYGGRPNRAQDQDLAGVVFCDAPWLLNETSATERQTAVEHGVTGANARLWAMGMDAYRLSRRLNALTGFNGASGELSLKPGNRIHRRLQCARFEGGVPVPLSPDAEPAGAPEAPH